MKVLLLTNMWPSPKNPINGIFVQTQVDSIRALGVEFELMVVGRPTRLDYLRGIFAVRARAARGGFDLVHAHHGLSGFLAVQQRLKPVVVTFVGSDVFGVLRPDGRPTLPGRLLPSLSRFAARRAQRSIAVSRQLAERLAGPGPPPIVLPMGVDLRVFQPRDEREARARLRLDDHRPRVLFVGRTAAPVKRFELAQQAVETLRRSRPDVELQVVNGSTSVDSLVDLLSACQCLLLTSRHEGSPQVVKEAMACNLPIVSTRVGDVEERFGDQPGHFLADPTPDALAAALEQALSHGRTTARERLSELDVPVVAERVRRIYESVASAPSSTR